ncbi:Zinc finger CCCH domain-containing protein 1 [Heracleum sosnowskyi]|uniref:Zinc finger CCCH domain-containing protein 1 n=1 Tax=Heracleum sosnowskyi TaxID=360622 RepID=A0AAD8HR83_9APIA|nr:Zinc finger CCCH domain-containing protein 1 [Heracleum sosnowskyi]
MADIPDPPSPRQSESVRNYFRQTARNENTRRRDRSEDNEVVEDEGSVIGTNLFKKKKSLVSDGKLHFSTAPTKRLMTSVGETEREQTLFQFESSSEIQVQNDSRATATLETETEFTSDARARRERVLKQAEAALKGENRSGGDDKLYKGINAYVDHKAGFRREQTVAGEKAGGSHGPLRASAHIRVSTRFDYQPDICKDYKETGYCGYGDSCNFLHDRGDYKSGWQLENEWDEKEKVKKRKLALKQLGIEEDAEQSDEDSLPLACFICSEAFHDPVVTKCKHYFCERCALKHHAKNKKCFVCNEPTLGIFNTAQEIHRRIVA